MLRKALFNIIRQEQRDVEDRLETECRRNDPDDLKLRELRAEAFALRRELEHYADM